MPYLIPIVLVVTVAAVLLLRQQRRQPVAPTDFGSLTLRPLNKALNLVNHDSQNITLSAVAMLNDNPALDIEQILAFMHKARTIDNLTIKPGSNDLQRVIDMDDRSLTLEPVAVQSGAEFPGQIRPASGVGAAADAVGAILVTATSGTSGVSSSITLSQGVLALLHTRRQANDVYWVPSETLFSRRTILREFGNLENTWPTDVWAACHAANNDAGTSDGYTLGLGALSGTEFEALGAPENPTELQLRFAGIEHHTIFNFGEVFNGDTIGVDGMECIRLKKAPSRRFTKAGFSSFTKSARHRQIPDIKPLAGAHDRQPARRHTLAAPRGRRARLLNRRIATSDDVTVFA